MSPPTQSYGKFDFFDSIFLLTVLVYSLYLKFEDVATQMSCPYQKYCWREFQKCPNKHTVHWKKYFDQNAKRTGC